MKKIVFYLAILTTAVTLATSCSKCYDCSYVTEIDNNGTIIKDTVTDEFCTASSDEIKQKESEGQTCVSQ